MKCTTYHWWTKRNWNMQLYFMSVGFALTSVICMRKWNVNVTESSWWLKYQIWCHTLYGSSQQHTNIKFMYINEKDFHHQFSFAAHTTCICLMNSVRWGAETIQIDFPTFPILLFLFSSSIPFWLALNNNLSGVM